MKAFVLFPLALLGLLLLGPPAVEARPVVRVNVNVRPGAGAKPRLAQAVRQARRAGLRFSRRNVGLLGGFQVDHRQTAAFLRDQLHQGRFNSSYARGYSRTLVAFFDAVGYSPPGVSVQRSLSYSAGTADLDYGEAPCPQPPPVTYSVPQPAILLPSYSYSLQLAAPFYQSYARFATVIHSIHGGFAFSGHRGIGHRRF